MFSAEQPVVPGEMLVNSVNISCGSKPAVVGGRGRGSGRSGAEMESVVKSQKEKRDVFIDFASRFHLRW